MIHPNEKPLLLQGKTLFAAFTLGFLLLLSSVSASANTAQNRLDLKLKSLVKHGSVLVADDKEVLYRYPPKSNPLLVPASVLKWQLPWPRCIISVRNSVSGRIFI